MQDSKLDAALKRGAFALGLGLGAFHILNVSGLLVLSTMIVRIVHLAAMLALVFLMKPVLSGRKGGPADHAARLLLLAASLAVGVYMLARWEAVALSGGLTNRLDLYAGTVLVAVILLATWKGVGLALAIVAAVFLLYPFLSPYLPGMLRSRSFSFERVFLFLTNTSQGIFGIPIGVSSTYIILFTIYGEFLSEFGAGDFFYRLSRALTRRMVAASAKTAVLFSTLIGMISGSAAGNVAVAGSFTIPLMKRGGYKNHEAAAVEALASTGGQIMPPVMGAAAFIMAELIGQPYVSVMKAGIIPALLFFTSCYFVVHLQARKGGLRRGLEEEAGEQRERVGHILLYGVQFIIPFAALIGMMIFGYSPFKASFYSILLLLAGHLVWKRRLGREFFLKLGKAVEKGARGAVSIAVACAAAGIIAGILSVTGLGSKVSTLIVAVSGGVPLVALLLTMVVAFILGMGLPTTAAYLILAAAVAPALVNMGVPLLSAHMFVFFYGCISTITPPVALASYVAAGIADADINKTGWLAFRWGLTSYFLPFMFVYGPALLMQGSALEIVRSVAMAVIGVYAIATGTVGFFRARMAWWARLLAVAGGILLIDTGWITDIIGIVLVAAVFAFNHLGSRTAAAGRPA